MKKIIFLAIVYFLIMRFYGLMTPEPVHSESHHYSNSLDNKGNIATISKSSAQVDAKKGLVHTATSGYTYQDKNSSDAYSSAKAHSTTGPQ